MNFTIYIHSITETKLEEFTNCDIFINKDSRYVQIEDVKGNSIVDFFLADSDRLEVRYHA